MRVPCSNCSTFMEVPDEFSAQLAVCPKCGDQLGAAPESPAVPAKDSKVCPFCAETIKKAATRCRFCQQEVPEAVDLEAVKERLTTKERKIAEGVAEIPASAGGLLRPGTWVSLSLWTASFAMTWVGGSEPGHIDGGPYLAFGIIGLIIFSLFLLVYLVNDLRTPSRNGRKTPEKGLKAFLYAIQFRRYAYAHACLVPGERDATLRERNGYPQISVPPAAFSFETLSGFKKYWKGLVSGGNGQSRTVQVTGMRATAVQGEYAQVQATITVASYPMWLVFLAPLALLLILIIILVITKRETIQVTKLMRRINGQWYVVNGEVDSPEDRCLSIAADLVLK